MSVFGEEHDKLARRNSQEYMKDVHAAQRKKNGQKTKKFKVSRHPLP